MFVPNHLWANALMNLENYFPEDLINTWFDGVEVIGLIDNTLVVYSPSSFTRLIIQEKCTPYILESLNSIVPNYISFAVWGVTELLAYRTREKKNPFYCKPQFMFDNFIIGNANRNAVNALKTAAGNPKATTPILLCGPAGSGKTHLLYAFYHSILQSSPETRIVYVNSDQFTAEMISSLRHDETDLFRQKYYNTDLLLVDDIQYFADKKSVQEEFSCIFNHLVQQKKQIILTFDRNSKDISIFEKCLKDCFNTGILIRIDPAN